MIAFRFLAVFGAAAFLTSVANAEVLSPGSDNFTEVGKEGPWTIYADANRQSCLIEGLDGAGNVVQMGLTSDHSLGYVGVFTPADVGLANGGTQEITIGVNGHAYSGEVKMREHGLADGYQGGYFLANNPQFVEDMMVGQVLIAFANDSGQGVEVDLTGSRAAIEAAASCTQSLMAQ